MRICSGVRDTHRDIASTCFSQRPAWLRGLILAMLVTSAQYTAAHAVGYRQQKFVVGVAGTAWTPARILPAGAMAETDTTQARLHFRALADAHVNLLLGLPMIANPKMRMKLAYEHGMMHMSIRGLVEPTIESRPTGITDAEWANFLGYFISGGDTSAGGIRPDENMASPTAPRRDALRTMNTQPSPGNSPRAVVGLTIQSAQLEPWAGVSDSLETFGGWCGEGYVPNGFFGYGGGHARHTTEYLTAAGGRPIWSLAYVNGAELEGLPSPTVASLRAMALMPVSVGAKGIIWIAWGPNEEKLFAAGWRRAEETNYSRPGLINGSSKTEKYNQISTINHYLKEVVGPVVMKTDFRYILHHSVETTEPWIPYRPEYLPSSDKPLFKETSDILGDSTMVTVLEPKPGSGEPAGTYYLFVMNRGQAPIMGSLRCRATGALSVGAAPSLIGYRGGSYYTPVDTVVRPIGGLVGTTFSVSLDGSEGRMYKLYPASWRGDIVALTAPAPGTPWQASSSRTFSWSDTLTNVGVKLFPSGPSCENAARPAVELLSPTATPRTSVTVQAPGLLSSGAWIEVQGVTRDGVAVRLTHQAPMTIKAALIANTTVVTTQAAPGVGYTGIAASGGVAAGLLTYGADGFRPRVWKSATSGLTALVDTANWMPGWSTLASFGLSPRAVMGADGTLHAIYTSLFTDTLRTYPEFNDESFQYHHQNLRYVTVSGSAITKQHITELGLSEEGAAIMLQPDGTPVVAYNGGSSVQFPYSLHLRRRTGAGRGEWAEDLGYRWVGHPTNIDLAMDSQGQIFVSARHPVEKYGIGMDGGLWYDAVGVNGPCAMQLGDGDVVEWVLTRKSSNSQSQTLEYFHDLFETGSNDVGQILDSSTQTVTGARLQRYAGHSELAYATNGALRWGTRAADGAWSIVGVEIHGHTVSEQLDFAISSDGTRWFSFYDRDAQQLVVLKHKPEEPGGGGGEGGDEPILHAIALKSGNPLVIGQSLRFGVRLSRAGQFTATLFDVAGRVAEKFAPPPLKAGQNELVWTPKGIKPGVYFVRASIEGRNTLTRRVVLTR